uniref:SD-repeat containing protein B domain-containing protein n=1 Tax=Thermodesulfobacterium geofontis TaxID=1295609 RepID=A0A7V5XG40_9BACT
MRIFILLMLIFLLFTKIGLTHKINTFAYREGDQVTGEAYFADGSPCIKCKVEVYSDKGTKILEITTDEKGKYSFTTKEKGSIKIKVIAGEGHLAECKVEGLKNSQTSKTEESKIGRSKTEEKVTNLKMTNEEMKIVIKEAVSDAIKETIKPETEGIKNLLVDVKKDMDRVKLHDIIGGIGYIFGIWGIITILKFRKK